VETIKLLVIDLISAPVAGEELVGAGAELELRPGMDDVALGRRLVMLTGPGPSPEILAEAVVDGRLAVPLPPEALLPPVPLLPPGLVAVGLGDVGRDWVDEVGGLAGAVKAAGVTMLKP